MKNLTISLPLADGGVFDLDYDTGKELIQGMVSDDWGPPPRCMVIEATSEDGRTVAITIPYSDDPAANVSIEKPSPL